MGFHLFGTNEPLVCQINNAWWFLCSSFIYSNNLVSNFLRSILIKKIDGIGIRNRWEPESLNLKQDPTLTNINEIYSKQIRISSWLFAWITRRHSLCPPRNIPHSSPSSLWMTSPQIKTETIHFLVGEQAPLPSSPVSSAPFSSFPSPPALSSLMLLLSVFSWLNRHKERINN